ncbi:carbohydrate ABC transporter permease [Haloprofundus halobius]|uniref:carbohydrate ABC transporter permease n=1 Tax=Haloprofundus halobius TaxID=2876194 RepID=UPI003CCCCBB9
MTEPTDTDDAASNMPRQTDTESTESGINSLVQRVIANPSIAYKAAFYLLGIFFLVTTLFPFYWLVILAITPNNMIAGMGPYPRGFNFGAFVEVFQAVPFHIYIFNSIFIATFVTALVLILGSLAGYAFGRFEFRGRTPLLLVLLVISYFPPAAVLVPLFNLLTGNTVLFGVSLPDLYNTPWAIVTPLSALTMPFAIYILTVFYSQIPDGLEDAARIEGTTRLGALFRVIVPLSAPGVVTAGVLTFIAVYNEFFFSFLMTDGEAVNGSPLVWGIMQFQAGPGQYQTPYNLMAAASLIGIIPVAILVLLAQERIVSGLTAGALKE